MTNLFPARWCHADADGAVCCELCPRHCQIAEGATGYCGVRRNQGGVLYSLAYGHPVSVAIDPIEKKPLAHFLPHSRTLSFGTFGCNLGCVFCQNHTLSRGSYEQGKEWESAPSCAPQQIVEAALQHRCPSISYTYNEPTVFAEYVLDIARRAREAGLKNVLVSNGYISPAVAEELYPWIDAANIDMKGFSESFYATMCQASLTPVLQSLETLKRLGVHLEITTLVIPGQNDSLDDLDAWLDWLEPRLGLETPLHFSAYHPAYRCQIPPTPRETLYAFREAAVRRGCPSVHLGNIW